MVWRSGNNIGHSIKVILCRARLVLALMIKFGGSTIPVSFMPLSLAILHWLVQLVLAMLSATAGEETANSA